MMDREAIDDVVCEIMRRDGPDRHIDGHDVITEYIMALLGGTGEEWARRYASRAMGYTCPCGTGEESCPGPDGRPLCADKEAT